MEYILRSSLIKSSFLETYSGHIKAAYDYHFGVLKVGSLYRTHLLTPLCNTNNKNKEMSEKGN
jgi:hypothetical protein